MKRMVGVLVALLIVGGLCADAEARGRLFGRLGSRRSGGSCSSGNCTSDTAGTGTPNTALVNISPNNVPPSAIPQTDPLPKEVLTAEQVKIYADASPGPELTEKDLALRMTVGERQLYETFDEDTKKLFVPYSGTLPMTEAEAQVAIAQNKDGRRDTLFLSVPQKDGTTLYLQPAYMNKGNIWLARAKNAWIPCPADEAAYQKERVAKQQAPVAENPTDVVSDPPYNEPASVTE